MVAFYENKDKDLFIHYGNSLDFAPHLHNHIELIYMLEGETVTNVDGNKALLKKGEIFVSFPNQVHQYSSKGPEKYLIFIFSPDLFKEMKHIFQNYIPDNQVIKNAYKYPCLYSFLSSAAEVYESNHEFKDLQIKGYLLVFFAELLKIMKLKSIKTSNLSMLQNILVYCSENYAKDLSLDTISESLHVSKYYVSHLLKKKINIGFSDYINALRISEACGHLLSEDKSITEIAYLVGFNTIRTFNRAFIKQTELTPTDFRKKNLYGIKIQNKEF
ncbi:helix-turn-helix domain-containing protein [Vallitalea okinawensis]|uniref:helix-turn-helix domain-containing protein n=1 Tax=Vallitalea okinawensis TaxID=2078660 RepID=UPI000CFACC6C|nr:AraC family transcriptional regulator [Vallitalea okinawensis]